MINALIASLGALRQPYFWKYIALSALLTTLLFALALGGSLWALSTTDFTGGWLLDGFISFFGTASAFILSYFLFPLAFPLITTLFLDPVAHRMEQTHYPAVLEAARPTLWQRLPGTLSFLVVSLIINLIALPFYLIPGMYYLVNGYLFGREYFEMIAERTLPSGDIRTLRKRHRLRIFLCGVLITVLFTIPFLNLIAPVAATIFMMHIYHRVLVPSHVD